MGGQGRLLAKKARNRILWSHCLVPSVMAATCWIAYLAYVLFGRKDNAAVMLPGLLIAACIVTLCGAPYAVWRVRRAIRLYRHGLPVWGKVENVGRHGDQGLVQIWASYYYDGKTYRIRTSVPGSLVAGLTEKPEIELLVDPLRPTSWMLESDVLPPEKSVSGRDLTDHVAQPGDEPDSAPDSLGSPEGTSVAAYKADWRWWYYVVAGMAIGGCAVYLYYSITEHEISGGTQVVPGWMDSLYKLFGKWGVVGAFAGIAVMLVGVGFWCLSDERKANAKAQDKP